MDRPAGKVRVLNGWKKGIKVSPEKGKLAWE